MGKGYSNYIKADCNNVPLDNDIPLFKTINTHITFSSPQCSNQRKSGIFGCKQSNLLPPTPSVPYTEQIPINYVPPSDAVVFGKMYGKQATTPAITLKTLTGVDVYFNESDLTLWKPVKYCPPPYNVYERSGPAFTNCHCYGSMVRKLNNVNTYINRLMYDWIDTTLTVPYPRWLNWEKCGNRCITNNWLIMSHPAASLYTSIPEPFKITTHYNQSGLNAPSDATNGGNNYLPFCNPMAARQSDGTLIGYYTGLSFLTIFGRASIAQPIRPYLPPNEYSVEPDPTKVEEVDPNRAFYSLEVWTFFRGETDPSSSIVLGSPLISKIRYYLYSLAPGRPGQLADWRFPFRILFQQGVYGDYQTDIKLPYVGGGDLTITLNLTNMKVLCTY